MHKFFVISFCIVFALYILILSLVHYAGVYIHYVMIPLTLTLLLLSFLTKPGLLFGSYRTERTLQDDDYGFFDFILDCGRAIIFICKIPMHIVRYIKQDYQESQPKQKEKNKDQ
jgi:hypothetical protein